MVQQYSRNAAKKITITPLSDSVREVKTKLAQAFHLFARLGMDDLSYAHLSARHPENPEWLYINPLGPLFEEITPETLLLIDQEGQLVEPTSKIYNNTGYFIHAQVYKERPDVACVMHLHTPPCVAVSAVEEGLLPLSQFSMHFYERLGYHSYGGLALNEDEAQEMTRNLGSHPALLLRNHGSLTVGTSIHEAFFYSYYLHKACETQWKILSMGRTVTMPDPQICRVARDQMRAFEPDIGLRDWTALTRLL